jgi:hypothetical protein
VSSSIGYVFAFINLMYIVAQLLLLVVAIYFWRRYPRPSQYLAIAAALEVFGTIFQTALPFFLSRGFTPVLVVHSLTSLIRLGVHVLAMCFIVMAVYVARRPNSIPATGTPLQPGTPGMENGDQAFILDPNNPYSPPRQPR